jgi:hypothetical protein
LAPAITVGGASRILRYLFQGFRAAQTKKEDSVPLLFAYSEFDVVFP